MKVINANCQGSQVTADMVKSNLEVKLSKQSDIRGLQSMASEIGQRRF